jgi:hypothetical protein
MSCKDPFDEMVRQAEERYHKAASWEQFLEESRDPRGDLSPKVKHIPRRAGHLLDIWCRTGAPVVTKNNPWLVLQKLQALKRGGTHLSNQPRHLPQG